MSPQDARNIMRQRRHRMRIAAQQKHIVRGLDLSQQRAEDAVAIDHIFEDVAVNFQSRFSNVWVLAVASERPAIRRINAWFSACRRRLTSPIRRWPVVVARAASTNHAVTPRGWTGTTRSLRVRAWGAVPRFGRRRMACHIPICEALVRPLGLARRVASANICHTRPTANICRGQAVLTKQFGESAFQLQCISAMLEPPA